MQDITFDYSALRGRIAQQHLTLDTLSKKIGLSQNSLSNKIKYGLMFKSLQILALLRALDLEISEVGTYFFVQKN